MESPSLKFEAGFGEIIAGIDEAGRGPWAGPVVASAVILNRQCVPEGLHDSKKLTAARRNALFVDINRTCHVGIGIASAEEIDEINILQATFLAMQRAYKDLGFTPDIALVDGNHTPKLPCPAQYVIGGDARCPSIAAASIIAKVTRDGIMAELGRQFPQYGWERNAGYGTAQHIKALAEYGVTPYHRRSYKPVKAYLNKALVAHGA
ncbi:MAG: ribonuclease HII [Alphaproteobacteria bacterium]